MVRDAVHDRGKHGRLRVVRLDPPGAELDDECTCAQKADFRHFQQARLAAAPAAKNTDGHWQHRGFGDDREQVLDLILKPE